MYSVVVDLVYYITTKIVLDFMSFRCYLAHDIMNVSIRSLDEREESRVIDFLQKTYKC